MNKLLLLMVLIVFVFCFSNVQGQKINLPGKVKSKSSQRADQRSDEGVDKGLDKVEDGIKNLFSKDKKDKGKDAEKTSGETPESSNDNPDVTKNVEPGLQAYSKFDFVPGEEVVFFEDFLQDAVGDFPANWYTNGSGEVVTLNNYPGNWLMMTQNSKYCYKLQEDLPENYTIEFDFIRNNCESNSNYTTFYLFSVEKNDNAFSRDDFPGFKIEISHESSIHLYNWGIDPMEQVNNNKAVEILKEQCNKPVRVSIWVQKQRVRVYFNEIKAFDIPRLLPKDRKINVFRFDKRLPDKTDFISNVRIAVGAPDTRNKLLTEGRFVTHGIKFDVGSDKIKPESYGVLKEIATVLGDNAGLKVKITGHTDSDGDDASNLQLSQKRALSVKNMLNSEFGIADERMETDGKGEKEPMSSNDTPEGKANNRRVEFIRL